MARKTKSYEDDPDETMDEPHEELRGEESKPPDPPATDDRPPNPLPPVPRVSITWLGSNNPEGPQVKRWNGIDFKINEPVVVPEQLQRAMAKDAEGSKAWKVEVV